MPIFPSARLTQPAMWLLLGLSLSACTKSPEATVESFYRAVGHGELTEARGYLSSQVTAMLGPEKTNAVLSQETAHIARCGGIKALEVQLQGEGELRTGTVRVTYGGDCAAKTERVKLLQEDGKWKIGASK